MDNKNIPDWIKYQINGKTANENYREIVQKRQQALKEIEEYKELRKAQIDIEIEKQIEEEIIIKIENALEDLIKEWH